MPLLHTKTEMEKNEKEFDEKHKEIGWDCVAHSEGQNCCCDIWVKPFLLSAQKKLLEGLISDLERRKVTFDAKEGVDHVDVYFEKCSLIKDLKSLIGK
jgi:hypothetical protein